jgi:hypothetical protein
MEICCITIEAELLIATFANPPTAFMVTEDPLAFNVLMNCLLVEVLIKNVN